MKTKAKTTAGRIDAWDAGLTEPQRWQAYDRATRSRWYEFAAWAKEEFGLRREPGRNAVYSFKTRLREMESAHRIEQAVQARDEIGALANTTATDAALIDAYKSMAADLALKGDAKSAVSLTVMAMEIGNAQRKQVELELKARAQQTKDEQLKLAREKFEAAEARLSQAKDVVSDAKLSDAERTARMKEIFGL